MIGAIAGDIIGSLFEFNPTKSMDFPLFRASSRFTDDTVLTLAVADAILHNSSYADSLKRFASTYPDAGYGMSFFEWVFTKESQPYNSWGNGSAMRVSPVGFAFDSIDEVLRSAKESAAVTHNHPEGIKGAQATALCIFMARSGAKKESIRAEIQKRFSYDLERSVQEIRPTYSFDVSCQGSVPESIIAFFESSSYEDAVRTGISLGGDSDTIACITGGIAQAYYKEVPEKIILEARRRLPGEFLEIIDEFRDKFGY
ncbi:ADP-ribosylglycohydrolase family protein [Candidatus Riflebacteria bacterium]